MDSRVIAAAVVALLFVACSGDTTQTCSASNCTGCCSNNACQPGDQPEACGTGGGACSSCAANQTCSSHSCQTVPCLRSNCDGCCDSSGICQLGNENDSCGAGAVTCTTCGGGSVCHLQQCTGGTPCSPTNPNGACPAGKTCVSGSCQAPGACNASNCDGCCAGDVCKGGGATSACGASGKACAVCGTGQTCTNGSCQGGTGCSASSCPSGCCLNDVCQPGNTTGACGTGGGSCAACGASQSCTNGVCTGGQQCGPSTCPTGCCLNGSCQSGSSTGACGTNGGSCAACGASQSCTNGVCTGGQQCGPSTCPSGCCLNGACQAGNSSNACGKGGGSCSVCTGGYCDSTANSCIACNNTCQTAGATVCTGLQVQTCMVDAHGCQAWNQPAACPGGYCDATQNKCVACNNTCAALGLTQCSGAQIQTCSADVRGCLAWGSATACPSGGTCDAATNKCSTPCTNTCPGAGATQCSGVQIQTCLADGQGCLAWSSPGNCSAGTTCDPGTKTCATTCTSTCPTAGATQCSGTNIQTCTLGGNGCRSWSTPIACPTGMACSMATNNCQTSCQNDCNIVGATKCSGTQIVTCTADGQGCLKWGTPANCGGAATCDAASGHCVKTCNNTCTVEGATQCSGINVQTCNADQYGCLAWSNPTGCPNGASCDASANACVYDPCQGITANGVCQDSTTLKYCGQDPATGKPAIQIYKCPAGYSCQIDGTGAAKCLSSGVCSNGQTQCSPSSGNVLETCVNGQWSDTTCAKGCQTGAGGAYCVVDSTTKSIKLTVIYDAHQPNAGKTDWDPALSYYYLPTALVLSTANGSQLDAQLTDDSGAVTIKVPTTPGANDTVTIVAAAWDGTNWIFMVADPNLAAGQQQVGGALGANPNIWAWSWLTSQVQDGSQLEITEAYGSGAAHIYNYMQAIYRYLWGNFNKEGMKIVGWFGSGVTWSCGACFWPQQVSFGNPAFTLDSQVFFGSSSDQEYFADSVLAHEHGHWVMASYGTSPDEGGTHYLGNPTFPGQAWSEGWATFFGSYFRQSPLYIDKQGGSMFWIDISQRADSFGYPWQRPTPSGGLLQRMDENEVSAMMWTVLQSGTTANASILTALASPRMNKSPWARGYTQRTWDVDATGTFSNIVDTGISRPCIADMFDALLCGGMTAATIDTATDPIHHYPFPSSSPICQ